MDLCFASDAADFDHGWVVDIYGAEAEEAERTRTREAGISRWMAARSIDNILRCYDGSTILDKSSVIVSKLPLLCAIKIRTRVSEFLTSSVTTLHVSGFFK